nr:phosphofructokinase C-type subunit [Rattus norvegicus]
MSDQDSSTSSTSFPKYLEHLSGDGKAIGVLTSGGDAQGAPVPGPRAGGEGFSGG